MLDGAAHDALRLAVSVPFGSIEEVDASVEGGFEASERVFVTNMSSIWGVNSVLRTRKGEKTYM